MKVSLIPEKCIACGLCQTYSPVFDYDDGGEAALFWSLGLTDLGSYLLFVVCLPFALWGWWRPKGLKPERYLGYMLRQRFGPKVYPLEPHVPARFPGKPSLKEKTRRRIGGRKARRHV